MEQIPATDPLPIVVPGRNCWRVERAERASVIIDAAAYYHVVREAMEAAQRLILLIGWDFDTRISLEPKPTGSGETLGRFMMRLARARPDRDIRILKWNFGALKLLLSVSSLTTLLRWKMTRAISYRFDSAHPAGCSHHQKLVVIDDRLAVCGGIDTSSARWDTSEHLDDDPHRRLPNGRPYAPWHDVTMLMQGPVAGALGELGRERWTIATGDEIAPVDDAPPHWPEDLAVNFENVDIAIARTRAAFRDHDALNEIEALWLDMIAAAKRSLYIENQYFTSGKIAAAIAKRMAEDDPPEIVLIMPKSADGWLEQLAMDAARVQLARTIGKVDRLGRFRIYVPHTRGQTGIYVHAKLAIVDDRLLRVGSANLNNRSMALDSECDVAIDAALPVNRECGPAIAALCYRLLGEHLGIEPDMVASSIAQQGSLIGAIEALRGSGKTLEPLDLNPPGEVAKFIAENELLDPESADGFFEPLSQRGLRKSWRARLKWRLKRWRR